VRDFSPSSLLLTGKGIFDGGGLIGAGEYFLVRRDDGCTILHFIFLSHFYSTLSIRL
jgi:hypothetical protein